MSEVQKTQVQIAAEQALVSARTAEPYDPRSAATIGDLEALARQTSPEPKPAILTKTEATH